VQASRRLGALRFVHDEGTSLAHFFAVVPHDVRRDLSRSGFFDVFGGDGGRSVKREISFFSRDASKAQFNRPPGHGRHGDGNACLGLFG
jgi:hypothetical protein